MKIFIIVVFFGFITGMSLLHPGLPPTHDGEYHVIRFYEFDKVLRDGSFYPRWAPDLNNGYGVPLFNYVYPLPNYFASLLHLFGISFIDAFKLNMFFATIIGAVSFYFWARIFWGNLGGIMSSVFYTFAPYHLVDIYVRGSVGEVWALALFPAFLWSITKYVKHKNKFLVPLSALFLSLVILSHNILALLFFVFSLFYLGIMIYLSKDKRELLLNMLLIIVLGFSLSSTFWLPALFEKEYVRGLEINSVDGHFPEIYQLIFPSWGTGFSGLGLQNQMSFQIGLPHLAAVILSLLVYWRLRKTNGTSSKIILLFIISFVILFFLMINISLPIWKAIPLMNYFQFPWRLLSLEIVISSFLAGSLVIILSRKKILLPVVLFIVLVFYYGYSKTAYNLQRNDEYYITRSNFIDGTNSPGNAFNTIWINAEPKRKKEKVSILDQNSRVEIKSINPTHYKFVTRLAKSSEIFINTAYFVGWEAFVDKKRTEIEPSRDGRISFFAPKGVHEIEVKFSNTTLRTIADSLSLASILIIAFLFIKFLYVKINR